MWARFRRGYVPRCRNGCHLRCDLAILARTTLKISKVENAPIGHRASFEQTIKTVYCLKLVKHGRFRRDMAQVSCSKMIALCNPGTVGKLNNVLLFLRTSYLR